MAKIDENLLVKGARGNLGKQFVYKKRGEDTHITRMPRINKSAAPSEKQMGIRELFFSASQYAKGAVADPVLKKEYQKKATARNNAYNIAFRDYLKAPVVKSVDTGKYSGTPGAIIMVTAKDDFRVAEVFVTIHDAAGNIVEQGNAILNPVNRNQWDYTATQTLASPAGAQVTATAKDLPGHEGKLSVTI